MCVYVKPEHTNTRDYSLCEYIIINSMLYLWSGLSFNTVCDCVW